MALPSWYSRNAWAVALEAFRLTSQSTNDWIQLTPIGSAHYQSTRGNMIQLTRHEDAAEWHRR